MNYNIKITRLNREDWSTKAFVTVVFAECFKVTDITIVQSKNGGLFVSMPSYKTNKVDETGKTIYADYCNPTTKEFRKELYDNILDTYKREAVEMGVTSGSNDLAFSVSLNTCNGNDIVKKIGSIVFDNSFAVNGVRVMNGSKGVFVAMPSKEKKNKDGTAEYIDVCYPVTKEFRKKLFDEIIRASE